MTSKKKNNRLSEIKNKKLPATYRIINKLC